jgi:outer membrane protein OmpA-like peptidoglycan-associated protein
VFAGAFFPSSNHELYQYDKLWQAYARAAPSFGLRLAYLPLRFLGAEIEGSLTPTAVSDTMSTSGARALLFAGRGHLIAQLPLYSVVPFVVLGGGLLGTRGDTLGKDVDLSGHFGGGVKVHVHRNIAVRFDVRGTVGSGHGTETRRVVYPEVLLGISVPLALRGRDSDGDGLFDPGQRARPTDECPQRPGDLRHRGCPDRDDDLVPDPDDHCPGEPGLADRHGCPRLRDRDNDLVYDPGQVDIPPPGGDECPDVPGDPAYIGCPVPDSDQDGDLDTHDKCPHEREVWNGYQDEDGCPDELPVDITAMVGTLRGINFGFLSDTITTGSRPALDRAASVMVTYPGIRIEIQGHTDDEGDPSLNEALSLRRAEAVRQYLIQAGVPAQRLRAAGFGGSKPIADNRTAAGKAKNRRIELVLITGTESIDAAPTSKPAGGP